VGCITGLALLIAAGAILVVKRRRKSLAIEHKPANQMEVIGSGFLEGTDSGGWRSAHHDSDIFELPDTSRHELSSEPPTKNEPGDSITLGPQAELHESDDTVSPVEWQHGSWRISID
jgi:hypothetical protein